MPKHNKRGDSRRSRRQEDAPYEKGEDPEDGEMLEEKPRDHKKGHHDDRKKDKHHHHKDKHGHKSRRSGGGGGGGGDTEPCATFDDMKLKPDLLRGIYAYGFEKPSAIQQRAIRPIVRGRDVIAQSQSGTGKTAVFSISSLQLLDETSRDVQVLVLSPTRELAEQSQRVMQSLGDFMNVSSSREGDGKRATEKKVNR
jgi:superfamily II DNA or RNA helicase